MAYSKHKSCNRVTWCLKIINTISCFSWLIVCSRQWQRLHLQLNQFWHIRHASNSSLYFKLLTQISNWLQKREITIISVCHAGACLLYTQSTTSHSWESCVTGNTGYKQTIAEWVPLLCSPIQAEDNYTYLGQIPITEAQTLMQDSLSLW